MPEEGPCCGFKRKTVVMSFIGLCCLSLVAWTVVETANSPLDPNNNATNTTNISLALGSCTYNSSEPLEQVKLVLLRDGESNIARRNFIKKTDTGIIPLCKCFCRMNITEEMLIEAMKYIEFNSTAATILNQRRNAKKPAAGPTADPRSETGLTADSPMAAGSSIAMVADEEDTININ